MIFWESNYVTLGDWSQAVTPFTISESVQRHFDNDDFYALNKQILAATTEEERVTLVEEIAALMNEEAAAVFLSWKQFFYVHTTRLDALPFNLDTSPRIHAIEMAAE
jgi:ABC-type transport system substrate-binding protein